MKFSMIFGPGASFWKWRPKWRHQNAIFWFSVFLVRISGLTPYFDHAESNKTIPEVLGWNFQWFSDLAPVSENGAQSGATKIRYFDFLSFQSVFLALPPILIMLNRIKPFPSSYDEIFDDFRTWRQFKKVAPLLAPVYFDAHGRTCGEPIIKGHLFETCSYNVLSKKKRINRLSNQTVEISWF